ncbi:hypothetical protein FGO68_gene15053 [Halteria grandinella]|uniref:EF-hand domain-containing protein n=1 Tax=Halteria grandinella TaxID=5974 RepID=A0A8J8TA37_HALGN|nr:hypothetical protein FGO68_gene15053 [Halteria grandinella]
MPNMMNSNAMEMLTIANLTRGLRGSRHSPSQQRKVEHSMSESQATQGQRFDLVAGSLEHWSSVNQSYHSFLAKSVLNRFLRRLKLLTMCSLIYDLQYRDNFQLMAQSNNLTLAIFDRKLVDFQSEIEELADEFAANDDGDIELRDVHTYIMELVKLVKMEIESSNMMANFVLSTFVKEFVDFAKSQRLLKNLSATLQPNDINSLFKQFLQKKASLITLIDLKPTQQPPKQPPQQQPQKQNATVNQPKQPIPQQKQGGSPQQPSPSQPVKAATNAKPGASAVVEEEEGSEYEEIEEEFEEEIEEEGEEEFGDVADIISPAKNGQGKPNQASAAKKETEKDGKSAGKKKKENESPIKVAKESVEKQPVKNIDNKDESALKQARKVIPTIEKQKEALFEEKVEVQAQQWKESPEKGKQGEEQKVKKLAKKEVLPEIILPDEDENEFQGHSPVRQDLPDSPNVHQKQIRKANNEHAQSKNEKIPHLEEGKLGEFLNKQTMKANEELQNSLLNIDKYLLESQDTYKSPGLLDDIPDYIRQLSSTAGLPVNLNDPQIQDAIQEIKKQITLRQQENGSPQTHYDDRMLQDNSALQDDQNGAAQKLVIPRSKQSITNAEKKSQPSSPAQQQQKFALQPIRNPTSDSMKEEAKLVNTLNKKEVPEKKILQIKKIKRVFEIMLPQKFESSKVETWYATLNVSRVKANHGIIQLSVEHNEEKVMPELKQQAKEVKPQVISEVKDEGPKIDTQLNNASAQGDQNYNIFNSSKQNKPQIQPIVEKQQKKETKSDPQQVNILVPKVVNIVSVKSETGKIFYQGFQQDVWNQTLGPFKRTKAEFGLIIKEKDHQNEKIIQLLEPVPQQQQTPKESTKKITVPHSQPPTEPKPQVIDTKIPNQNAYQPDAIKQAVLESQKATDIKVPQPSKVPPQKPIKAVQIITPEEEKKQPQQAPIQVKKQVDKPPPPIPEEDLFEKARKEKLNLEAIRKKAQKQWKREHEGMEGDAPQKEENKELIPKIQTNNLIKKEEAKVRQEAQYQELEVQNPPKLIEQAKRVPPRSKNPSPPKESVNFAGQLRQTERPKEKKVKQEAKVKQLDKLELPKTQPSIEPTENMINIKFLPISPTEDTGNHSDTSPQRKNTKLLMNDARSQLVKAIQLYDRMIMRLDTEDREIGRHQMLLDAVNDLKEQLKSMEDNQSPLKEESKSKTERNVKASSRKFFDTSSIYKGQDYNEQLQSGLISQNPIRAEQQLLPDQSNMAEKHALAYHSTLTPSGKDIDDNAKRTIEQLKQLFGHYSKQKISIKNEYTFEDFKEEHGILNLSKVIAFIQDFEVSISTMKVAELFKKCAIQSKYMHFDQFQDFIEKLYVRQFDTDRDNLKRKLLSTNFKIKKATQDVERESLIKEKAEIKAKLRGLNTLGLEINQIYKQVREDLKMDDPITYHQRMRGYIPEYEKLPKIVSIKAPSPKRMEIELSSASKGVPKIPELIQLQNIIRKNKEEEQAFREKLREQSRTHRKNLSSLGPSLAPLSLAAGYDSVTMRQPTKIHHRPSIEVSELSPMGAADQYRAGGRSSQMETDRKRKNVTIANTPELIIFPDLIKNHRTTIEGDDYSDSLAPSPMISRTLNKSALKSSLNPYNQKQY